MEEPAITSLQNPRVKRAAKLRDRRERDRQGQILVDGAREMQRAIAAGVEFDEIFVCPALCRSEEARQALDAAQARSIALVQVTAGVFEKLAFGHRAEGLLGVARPPDTSFNRLTRLTADPLIAVLEGVEKPGNVGAVLRTADAAGVAAVLLADPRTDAFNPNAIRASLGTIFTVPLAVAPTSDVLAWLSERRFRILAAQVGATYHYDEPLYAGPTAIVLGSEAHGLSEAWRSGEVIAISLPMHGIADSLNVATTAAVLFYEARRQRKAAN